MNFNSFMRKAKLISSVVLLVLLFCGCMEITHWDQVCYKDHCFEVEVVKERAKRRMGLMFRESLDEDKGMLFVFDKSYPYSFWMKNTLIPLDMIWIDKNKEVVHIERNVPSCKMEPCPRYSPRKKALYVLEVNAGQAEKVGLQEGSLFEFNFNLVRKSFQLRP